MSRQYKSSDEVPNEVLAARLRELADFITKPSKRADERLPTEFYMRIPAEVDHDADLVMCEAARRLTASAPAASPEAIKRAIITYHAAIADAYDNQDDDAPPMGQELREYVGMRAVLRVAASPEMMEVDEEVVRRFVDNLEENQRAYIAWDEMYVEDADDYTPCVKIDGAWTVGALQDALTAALKGKS